MMIPATTRDALLQALHRFDDELRATPDWQGWEGNGNFKFAIECEGRRYPVKQIISLATGAPTSSFSGGDEANGYVTRLGFQVVSLRTAEDAAPEPRQVWWVNQGSTLREEQEEGILWAPLKDKRGGTQYHWETMAEVRPGDVVLHYANGALRYVSRVTRAAEEAARPNQQWNEQGRLVCAEYHELRPPVPLDKFAPQVQRLGIKQGPINSANGANQGYLFRFTQQALDVVRASQPETSWPDFAIGRAFWIFQSNPDYFDSARAVRELPELTWLVNQHKERVKPGDRVFLWESGPHAGAIALCTVLTQPADTEETEEERRYNKTEDMFAGAKTRVRLRIDSVPAHRVLRRLLLDHPVLGSLTILRAPQQTNYALTAEQGATLEDLMVAREHEVPSGGAEAPQPTTSAADRVSRLIDHIQQQGYVFEPWQIAAYVAAMRTKPFLILAGVSGTGKSRLPKLVATATGGASELIPVRPDWTDSSEVLGYVDLSGSFRPGRLLTLARDASSHPDRHFTAVVDEMNLARVEHYFAEVLSGIEDRVAGEQGGCQSAPLLNLDLLPDADSWREQRLPANMALVGTVNMDESSHGFSRKVLDRAFTLEFSDLDLTTWNTNAKEPPAFDPWPVEYWFPRATRLADLTGLTQAEVETIGGVIQMLTEVNGSLVHAQLQVGYRTRDEVALFAIHANEFPELFTTRSGDRVGVLDLALLMKVLPRIVGGSTAIRRVLLELLGWATDGTSRVTEEDVTLTLSVWDGAGRPTALKAARLPRTAARLCLMLDRLQGEGYTSFWL
jgi:hypothetical protein